MWPFRRKKPSTVAPAQVSFSQIDITERFDDHLTLKPGDWLETKPLNTMVPNGESMGLPARDASIDDVYRAAEALSRLRETMSPPKDGVYCPICHRANIELARLREPCPQCQRPLLRFGWD